MQLRAKQTSLEPLPAGWARTGRTPFVSQPSGRQPVREPSRRTQRPRVTNLQAPAVDLNKLPVLAGLTQHVRDVPCDEIERAAVAAFSDTD